MAYLAHDKKPIHYKRVYKVKYKYDGSVERQGSISYLRGSINRRILLWRDISFCSQNDKSKVLSSRGSSQSLDFTLYGYQQCIPT